MFSYVFKVTTFQNIAEDAWTTEKENEWLARGVTGEHQRSWTDKV